jgi:HSP20 family protein
MTAEQVSVEYHEGVLTISGERTAETDVSEKTFHRREFQYGKFTRQFRLREVDADHLQAEFQHGILRVTAPKMEVAKPKRVEIKAQ